jgi:hypothetical protein
MLVVVLHVSRGSFSCVLLLLALLRFMSRIVSVVRLFVWLIGSFVIEATCCFVATNVNAVYSDEFVACIQRDLKEDSQDLFPLLQTRCIFNLFFVDIALIHVLCLLWNR